jgi:serine/threonine protein kinase/tetratricopeptide (TPR) repeat protein
MSRKINSKKFAHRYQILQELGEGGIGKVYKALDGWTGKNTALKVLSDFDGNASHLQEFKDEFTLLAGLKHPGVVEIFDFGYGEILGRGVKPLPYFTMEFVEGTSLQEELGILRLPGQTSSEYEKLYHLIWQICDVLEFLHLRQLVHCDLKPENLKITKRAFRPKFLDFGLAERMGDRDGKRIKGTLDFMAPEMFAEKAIDGRTDLYSLGIILYQLVTSQLPFSSDDPVKIASAHLQQKPVLPSKLNPHLPAGLNELIMKLLEKSPADRPGSAARVKEWVEEGLLPDLSKGGKKKSLTDKNRLAQLYSGLPTGREGELDELEDQLPSGLDSAGKFLLLSGEQGVGKTTLLKQLKLVCQLRGIIFVESHCLENQTVAYEPLAEIIRRLKPYVESRCDSGVSQQLKEIFQHSKKHAKDFPEAQSDFHQRLSHLLVEISRSLPFVMVLENLMWADPSTFSFLEYFLKLKDKGKILLCCSIREDGSVSHSSLRNLIEECQRTEAACYLKLKRFDLSRTKELILSKFFAGKFPPEFFSYVQKRTSGNPFFIVEVLKYLLEKNIIRLKDSAWTVDIKRIDETPVPDSIEAVLLKNLERYHESTIDFLNSAAVAGKKFSPLLLEELNHLDEETTRQLLASLTQDQILARQEDTGGGKLYYEFTNQSLQNLLYQRLEAEERKNLHLRVGEFLEGKSSEGEEPVFDLAFHFLRGRNSEKAYRYAISSAERMEQRFANHEVLRYLGDAIGVASQLADPQKAKEREVVALRKRADFCKTVGELNQAEKDYLAVLEKTEGTSDLKLLAETYNRLGEIYHLKHNYKKGIYYLQEAMKIHKHLNHPLVLADTLNYLGLVYWTDSQYHNAIETFKTALEIDKRWGNKLNVASTLNNMGLVYWSQHEYPQALKYFQEALSVYRELDNREWIARSLNNIGATLFELGQYRKCIDYFQESFEINRKIKSEKEVTFNLENLSEAYRKTGDYPAALRYGERGLKLARQIDFPARVGRILKDLGTTYLETGEYQNAYCHLQDARKVAGKIRDKELQVLARIGLSKLLQVLDDEVNSLKILKQAQNIIGTIGDEKSLIEVYRIKSRFHAKAKRFREAQRLLREALALAEKLNVGEEVVSLTLDSAELLLNLGETKRAKEFLCKAKDMGLERYILLQPRSHLIHGRAEWSRGDLSSAQNHFQAALDLAKKLNHEETLWQVHHALGKLHLYKHHIEKAYGEFQKAALVLKRLSRSIEDEGNRRDYLRESQKKELLSNLREVAEELTGRSQPA